MVSHQIRDLIGEDILPEQIFLCLFNPHVIDVFCQRFPAYLFKRPAQVGRGDMEMVREDLQGQGL